MSTAPALAALTAMAVVQGITTAHGALSDTELSALKGTDASKLDTLVVQDKKTNPVSRSLIMLADLVRERLAKLENVQEPILKR